MSAPCGIPYTFGWWQGEPVWFEGMGLPCTLPDLRAGVAALERATRDLQAAAVEYAGLAADTARVVTDRRLVIARLEGMADGHVDAA